MQAFYVICILGLTWLTIASGAPVKESVDEAHVDDSKQLEKRSVGKGSYSAFGGGNGLDNHKMVDWNQVYSKKDAAKRFALQNDMDDGLNSHGLRNMNMLDWERIFNKRQWMNKGGDDGFGNVGSLSNPEMQNWSKFFAKKRAFGLEDYNRELGHGNGLESQHLQDWSSIIGRRRRNIEQ